MLRAPFYAVSKDAYLFPAHSLRDGTREQHEEPVRQWCAYELIRAYGIKISDLIFESEVRVGSKSYRIDILVLLHGQPWIVIECKEPAFKKHSQAMDQAVSYAGAEGVGAEFAVYTNGESWHVQRRIQQTWTAVTDIPPSKEAHGTGSIDDLLLTMEAVAPLLHKLDEPLEGIDARTFLGVMQRFFCGSNLLTKGLDKSLRFGTDNLLRVLSVGPEDRHYTRDKLAVAGKCFEEFRKRRSLGCELPEIGENEKTYFYMQQLMVSMLHMIERAHDFTGLDARVIQLNVALLDYGRGQHDPKKTYPTLTPSLHDALRKTLSIMLAVNMNIELPDTMASALTSDMKSFCRSAWEQEFKDEQNQNRVTATEFTRAWFYYLCFWKPRR